MMSAQIEIVIGQAVQAFQGGDLQHAEKILKNLLVTSPNLLPALQIMGLICATSGNNREAVRYLKKAAKLNPGDVAIHYNLAKVLSDSGNDIESLPHHKVAIKLAENMPEAWLNYGTSLTRLKRYQDALHAFDRAIAINPNYPEAFGNKGALLTEMGRYEDALCLYQRAQLISPASPEIYLNMGVALKGLNRFEEAIDQYDKALKLNPQYVEALTNKGNIYSEQKRFEEAIDQYDKALKLNPQYVEALSNKGLMLLKQNHLDEARLCCERELQLNPKSSQAWLNRGLVFLEGGQYEDALSNIDTALKFNPDMEQAWFIRGTIFYELSRFHLAQESIDKALTLRPDNPEALDWKGLILRDSGRLNDALIWFDKAIACKTDFSQALANKGSALNDLRRYQEAIAAYEGALKANPSMDFLEGYRTATKLLIGDWLNINVEITNLSNKITDGKKVADPFATMTFVDNPELHFKAAKIWASEIKNFEGYLGLITKKRNSKIRIGYFSADLRQNHPVSALIIGLFEAHDREKFELYAFSHSAPQEGDLMRERMSKCFDRFIDTVGMSDLEVAKLARELGIDIAVDLSGYTHKNRFKIFSYRAAPIQATYLGYPGTLGAEFVDYLIADRVVIPPESQAYFSENIVYLPNTYLVDDPKRKISDITPSRAEQGLPDNAFIFCCFNNSYKITPDIVGCWSKILAAVEDSVLWLSGNNEDFQKNIIAEFKKYHIHSDRIIFSKRMDLPEDHLARLQLADIFLDTVPYNAHTTAIDALRVGLPVLTCMGEAFAGRVAASLLMAIDMPELICKNRDAYVLRATELARNPESLLKIREKLLNNRSTTPLFDAKLFAKGLEAAYSNMYERYQADLAPEHIDIRS